MNKLFDLGVYAFFVAGILVLTKPGSKGPALVKGVGSAFEGIVKAASGQK